LSTKQKILQAGALVFFLTVIAKGLATVKNILLANTFGMTGLTDAYFIALLLPNTLMYATGITILAGISSSVFSNAIARNEQEELSQTFSIVLNFALLFAGALTLLGILFMPAVIRIYVPGFQGETYKLAVLMARIMLPLVITYGIAMYLSATLNAFRHFFLPGFGLLVANSVIIVSIVFFADSAGIVCVAWGTALGFLISFSLQLFYLLKKKIRYVPRLNLRYPPVISFLKKSAPLLFVTAAFQITLLIDRKIAAGLYEGAVSALSYASQIRDLSVSVFVIPLLTVLLPEFARDAAGSGQEPLRERIRFGAEVLLAIVLFWGLYVAVFNREIITVLLQRGAFTAAAAAVTSRLLLIYMLAFFFQAGQLYLTYIYLGLQKTRILAVIGCASYVVKTVLIFALSSVWGIYGIAWATAIASVIYCSALLLYFKCRILRFSFAHNGRRLLMIAGCGIVLMLFFTGMIKTADFGAEAAPVQLLLRLGAGGGGGLLIYVIMLKVFRIFSFEGAFNYIKRHIRG